MTMDMTEITGLLTGVDADVFVGYPDTGTRPPYVAIRPLILDPEALFVSGDAAGWDFEFTAYAAAASVEASFNLATAVITALQGQRAGDSTLSASMGYTGVPVEGLYESQITIQVHQGGIS